MTDERVEYGVERTTGTVSFITGGYTLKGARAAVAVTGKWVPKASRVARREVGEWEPMEDDEK